MKGFTDPPSAIEGAGLMHRLAYFTGCASLAYVVLAAVPSCGGGGANTGAAGGGGTGTAGSAGMAGMPGGDFHFKVTTQMASVPTTGGPTGFPSMFIGANSNHETGDSSLPKAVSGLTTVPTTWIWNDNGTLADATANSYNATYDVWFSTSAAGEPSASGPSGGFLMVWLHKPADAQPIGSVSAANRGVTIPGVAGTWDVWIGPNGSRPCISYVAKQTTPSLSFDLNAFIKDAVNNRPNTIQSTWYLTNVFTGFEIWRGGVNLESTGFCVVVN